MIDRLHLFQTHTSTQPAAQIQDITILQPLFRCLPRPGWCSKYKSLVALGKTLLWEIVFGFLFLILTFRGKNWSLKRWGTRFRDEINDGCTLLYFLICLFCLCYVELGKNGWEAWQSGVHSFCYVCSSFVSITPEEAWDGILNCIYPAYQPASVYIFQRVGRRTEKNESQLHFYSTPVLMWNKILWTWHLIMQAATTIPIPTLPWLFQRRECW